MYLFRLEYFFASKEEDIVISIWSLEIYGIETRGSALVETKGV